MKATIEDLSPVKKRIHVELPPDEVDRKVNDLFKELGRKAKVPGFRPGKIPRKILEARFGREIADDAAQKLVNETFYKALEENEVFPLGYPLLEKEPLKQGHAFKYSAQVEVKPRITLGEYRGLEVEKEKCSVSEQDVEEQLNQIRKAHGKIVAVETERAVQNEDYVLIDYEAFENGEPIEGVKADNFMLRVGSNDFHPVFEAKLVGLAKNDETQIRVPFEKDHYHAKLAGRTVDFKVKVLDIKTLTLPDVDDAFAQGLGAEFKGLEDLKDKLRETITKEREQRIDRAMKQKLVQKVAETIEISLPEVLVDSEVGLAIQNLEQNLIRSGSSLEKAGLSAQKLRQDFRPSAEKRVKEMLILDEIARQNGLTVTEEDLQERFRVLGTRLGQDPDAVRKFYDVRNMTDSVREGLMEEKALNYLAENAIIREVEASEAALPAGETQPE
jgi:trigger factor